MKLSKLNAHFDGRPLLTRDQYEILVKSQRVFKTEVRFTPEQASKYLPAASEQQEAEGKAALLAAGYTQEHLAIIFSAGGLRFGYIFTETGTWEEARQYAKQRMMGETVIGLLGGVAQVSDELSDLIARLPAGAAIVPTPAALPDELTEQGEVDRWVSVTERLPEWQGRVLAIVKKVRGSQWDNAEIDQRVECALYCDRTSTWLTDSSERTGGVTHWRPFPELPKVESHDW